MAKASDGRDAIDVAIEAVVPRRYVDKDARRIIVWDEALWTSLTLGNMATPVTETLTFSPSSIVLPRPRRIVPSVAGRTRSASRSARGRPHPSRDHGQSAGDVEGLITADVGALYCSGHAASGSTRMIFQPHFGNVRSAWRVWVPGPSAKRSPTSPPQERQSATVAPVAATAGQHPAHRCASGMRRSTAPGHGTST